jgi:hypothetical protein
LGSERNSTPCGLQLFEGLAAIGGLECATANRAFLKQTAHRFDVSAEVFFTISALDLDEIGTAANLDSE